MSKTLHVQAVGDCRCALIDSDGRVVVGRFAARLRKSHEPMPGGEVVADHSHYQRALARGELALVVPVAAAPTDPKPAKALKEAAQ